MARSTLITSPRSQLDLLVRLLFFAFAPVGIVWATALFPVWGALASVLLALLVFVAAEFVRGLAGRSRIVRFLFARELAIEAYYRVRPPRPFLYYVFYPVLFPYWLINAEARREFWLFKGYTLASLAILIASVLFQYGYYWPPELGVRQFLPVVGLTLLIETLLVLGLLMPIATTVIELHQRRRSGRLVALLLLCVASTSVATWRIARRRDPIVSYATRERVRQRTAVQPKQAHDVQLEALKAAWAVLLRDGSPVDGDGKVEGPPLARAQQVLEGFYKTDEAFSFDLWASPRRDPKIMVLYFEARTRRGPIWVALGRHGTEITDPKKLPKGAFAAMRHAASE